MHRSQSNIIILLDLLLSALVGADLVRALKTGRARGRGSFITRQKQPEKYWRNVYASYVILALCAMVLIWAIIAPESF